MPTVYLQGDYGDALRRRLTGDGSRTYLPFGPIHARSVCLNETDMLKKL